MSDAKNETLWCRLFSNVSNVSNVRYDDSSSYYYTGVVYNAWLQQFIVHYAVDPISFHKPVECPVPIVCPSREDAYCRNVEIEARLLSREHCRVLFEKLNLVSSVELVPINWVALSVPAWFDNTVRNPSSKKLHRFDFRRKNAEWDF